MSNTIGYGAAAIRAGEVRYQHSMVELLKQAAKQPHAATDSARQTADAKPVDKNVGRNVDVKA